VTEQQRINAAKHRTASWFQIADGDHNEIRAQLAAGNPVVIGIPVYPDFDNLNSGNPVYDNASGISRGAHAVCVIGYDDNKSALKFTNSWGTGWGINGYGWISYDFIKEMNIEAYFMSDINDSASINVTPSTCYATMTEPGKATVNWEAKIPSRINVSKDGEKEILFSEHPAGTFSEIANFILPGSSYVFNLYDYSNNTLGPLLSSVTCKGFRKGSTMIRRADEMEKEIREQMRGGKGSVEISHLFKSNEFYGDSVSLMAKVTLNKKCSIGLHQHEADQEAIYILQGKGRVTNNGKTYELSAGDAILTGGGGTHSIENVHNDPLVLLAVILVVDEPPHL
jgi:quercetin dioxygenase-like cupin family protein